MKKEITQKDRVFNYMKEFGSISSLEAFKDLGITRLAAVIFELKKSHNIISELENCENRYGEKVYFSRYRLGEC